MPDNIPSGNAMSSGASSTSAAAAVESTSKLVSTSSSTAASSSSSSHPKRAREEDDDDNGVPAKRLQRAKEFLKCPACLDFPEEIDGFLTICGNGHR